MTVPPSAELDVGNKHLAPVSERAKNGREHPDLDAAGDITLKTHAEDERQHDDTKAGTHVVRDKASSTVLDTYGRHGRPLSIIESTYSDTSSGGGDEENREQDEETVSYDSWLTPASSCLFYVSLTLCLPSHVRIPTLHCLVALSTRISQQQTLPLLLRNQTV